MNFRIFAFFSNQTTKFKRFKDAEYSNAQATCHTLFDGIQNMLSDSLALRLILINYETN